LRTQNATGCSKKDRDFELSYSEMIPEQFPELERIIRVTFKWTLPK
jgi:hypothetical protein